MSASDLARRWAALVADGRGRWLPGMLDTKGARVVAVGDERVQWHEPLYTEVVWARPGDAGDPELDVWVPDFDDPATLGCLLALVRLAWGDRYAQTIADGDGLWRMVGRLDYAGLYGFAGEVECLLAALEAAPKGAK